MNERQQEEKNVLDELRKVTGKRITQKDVIAWSTSTLEVRDPEKEQLVRLPQLVVVVLVKKEKLGGWQPEPPKGVPDEVEENANTSS